MIEIKKITVNNKNDINLPNQPFKIQGKLIPSLNNGKWDYKIQEFAKISQQCFPNENYQYNSNLIYIGDYDNSRYIGLAIFSKSMFNYLYLDDLKIDIDYRRRHIGNQLIDAGLSEAKQLNLHNRSR